MIAGGHYWLYAIVVVYLHTGVGFGVARSTDRAMPEPQSVGRVTDRLPRFFLYMSNNLNNEFWIWEPPQFIL